MTTNLLVYHHAPDASVLAARLVIRDGGAAWFLPGDGFFNEIHDLIGTGVYSMLDRRLVTPEDGKAFFKAVEQMFDRSTTWSATREEISDSAG